MREENGVRLQLIDRACASEREFSSFCMLMLRDMRRFSAPRCHSPPQRWPAPPSTQRVHSSFRPSCRPMRQWCRRPSAPRRDTRWNAWGWGGRWVHGGCEEEAGAARLLDRALGAGFGRRQVPPGVRLFNVRPVSAGGGTGAAADAEALENVLQVVLHREKAAIEDVRDFRVGLPLGDPVQHLGLTRGQIQLLLEDLGGRCHLRMIFALWRTWF